MTLHGLFAGGTIPEKGGRLASADSVLKRKGSHRLLKKKRKDCEKKRDVSAALHDLRRGDPGELLEQGQIHNEKGPRKVKNLRQKKKRKKEKSKIE